MLVLFSLLLYQVLLCIFLSMLLQASNMVSGVCFEYVPLHQLVCASSCL